MKPRSRTVAIVTPDFVGPVRNGGVGTAMYWLARTLAGAGFGVEVVFTGVLDAGTPEHWEREFRDAHGFRFVDLHAWMAAHAPAEADLRCYPESAHRRVSDLALSYLRRRGFGAIYFQDYLGHGLRTLQSKRAGLDFADTRCIVVLHSSQRWIREGMEQSPAGLADLELDFQERECAVLADSLVAPSRHMAAWVAENWGIPPARIEVVPYCFEAPPGPKPRRRIVHAGFSHLVFFGRLETRKGLHLLLEALARGRVLRDRVRRVTFLGKRATVRGIPSGEAVATALRGTPYAWEIVDDKNAVEAWEWLREQRDVLVVAPSTLDNLPFSIIELFSRGIPFVTTDVGGIPEIVGPANRGLMAAATADGLAACLERHLAAGRLSIDPRSGYDPERANRANVAHLRRELARRPAPAPPRRAASRRRTPSVSVVVTHFNCAAYLGLALETLRLQEVDAPFEVVVVDDGSTDPGERARFRALGRSLDPEVFIFVEGRRNRGPGAARNLGARRARAPLLVFFDADNEAEPALLAVLLRAIDHGGYDCASCFSRVIPQADRAAPRPLDGAAVAQIFAPLGACLEGGFRHNLYGDTCAIWRRTVFERLGGFSEERVKFEDWELFTRLVVHGYRLGVVPEPLYRYRVQDGSYNTRPLDFASRRLILRNYNRSEAAGRVDVASLCALLAAETAGRTDAASVYDFFTGIRDEHLERYLALERAPPAADRGLQDIRAMRRCVEARLARWRMRRPRIMIYGAGLHTRVLLATNPELAEWLVGFIDQNPRGAFLGRPCVTPIEFNASMADLILYSSRPNELRMHANLAHHDVEHVLIYHGGGTDRPG